jgi:hypothetical protein
MSAPQAQLDLIEKHGGAAAIVRKYGLSTNAVANWKSRGIPHAWLLVLEDAHADKKAYQRGVMDTINKLVDGGLLSAEVLVSALVGDARK